MPITRKLIAQDNDACQLLNVNSSKRYIVVKSNDWQMLFNSKSSLGAPDLRVRGALEFDSDSFTKLRMAAYLYDQTTNAIGIGSSCAFKLYRVGKPNWSEQYITDLNGAILTTNSYFYAEIDTSLLGVEVLGETTFMISVLIKRRGLDYYNRFYMNHAGIYDNCDRLKKEVDWLDISKLDE